RLAEIGHLRAREGAGGPADDRLHGDAVVSEEPKPGKSDHGPDQGRGADSEDDQDVDDGAGVEPHGWSASRAARPSLAVPAPRSMSPVPSGSSICRLSSPGSTCTSVGRFRPRGPSSTLSHRPGLRSMFTASGARGNMKFR